MFTLQVRALLLAKVGAGVLDPRGQRDLYILGHGLLGAAHAAGRAGLAHHLLDALDAAVAVVEALGDGLGEALDLALFGALGLVVVEAGQHVLLV